MEATHSYRLRDYPRPLKSTDMVTDANQRVSASFTATTNQRQVTAHANRAPSSMCQPKLNIYSGRRHITTPQLGDILAHSGHFSMKLTQDPVTDQNIKQRGKLLQYFSGVNTQQFAGVQPQVGVGSTQYAGINTQHAGVNTHLIGAYRQLAGVNTQPARVNTQELAGAHAYRTAKNPEHITSSLPHRSSEKKSHISLPQFSVSDSSSFPRSSSVIPITQPRPTNTNLTISQAPVSLTCCRRRRRFSLEADPTKVAMKMSLPCTSGCCYCVFSTCLGPVKVYITRADTPKKEPLLSRIKDGNGKPVIPVSRKCDVRGLIYDPVSFSLHPPVKGSRPVVQMRAQKPRK